VDSADDKLKYKDESGDVTPLASEQSVQDIVSANESTLTNSDWLA